MSTMFQSHTPLNPTFDRDMRDLHLIYDYDVAAPDGTPEKWRYEMWFYSENRIVYAIYTGPMAGCNNYQTCMYQCIRHGELWQCNSLEETGTICSMVYDLKNQRMSTLAASPKVIGTTLSKRLAINATPRFQAVKESVEDWLPGRPLQAR